MLFLNPCLKGKLKERNEKWIYRLFFSVYGMNIFIIILCKLSVYMYIKKTANMFLKAFRSTSHCGTKYHGKNMKEKGDKNIVN